jgi:hypothetical protein
MALSLMAVGAVAAGGTDVVAHESVPVASPAKALPVSPIAARAANANTDFMTELPLDEPPFVPTRVKKADVRWKSANSGSLQG